MPTVGEILSAERRRQGKSLADAVEGTKIRSRLLDALEQGHYDELPSPAYVKGYIQSYARFLEIPVETLLEQYKHESAGTSRRLSPADRYLSEIPKEAIVPRRERAHEIPRNVWIAVAVVVVVVVLFACTIAQFLNPGSGADTNPAPVTGSGTETTASPGASSAVAATSVTSTNTGFKLRVSARTGLASYVKITIDGLNGYTGTLQGGASQEFFVTDRAQLTIGKPEAIVVTRDGKPVTVPSTANAQVTLKAAK
jgi:cytoskeletal protein RodZ